MSGEDVRMGTRRNRLRIGTFLLCMGLLAGMLTGCGNTRVIFTTGQQKDEVFRIDREVCTVPELMVYLTTTQRQYENAYGEEIWNAVWKGVSFGENVKENVLEKIAQIKTMNLMAKKRKVTLDETEQEKVKKAAARYLNSLSTEEKDAMQIQTKVVEKLYTEYALANKVYQQIIGAVDPEISDDEARTVSIQRIAFYKWKKNADGVREELDASAKNELYLKACEVREMACGPEWDFAELAGKYSDDHTLNYSVGKEDVDAEVARIIFDLETREISEVIETATGYYIVKCISTFDKSKTEENKKRLIEKRKNDTFGEEYEAFLDSLVRRINDSVWEEVSFLKVEKKTNTDFFQIYEEFFPHRIGL